MITGLNSTNALKNPIRKAKQFCLAYIWCVKYYRLRLSAKRQWMDSSLNVTLILQVPGLQPLDVLLFQTEVEAKAFFKIGHVAGAVKNGDLFLAFCQFFLKDFHGGFIAVGDQNIVQGRPQ